MNSYYTTNYTHCSSYPSTLAYFSSSDYVKTSMHINTCLTLPLSVYGCYCVIKVTPKELKHAKWALFHVHFWTIVMDVGTNIVYVPCVFFPAPALLILGCGNYLGIPPWFICYAGGALVAIYTSAAIGLVENRHSVLQTTWKIHQKWISYLVNCFNYTISTFIMLPSFLEPVDSQSMALETLKIIPCPVKDFFNPGLYFMTNNLYLLTRLMIVLSVILLIQGGFYVIHTWYHLVYAHNTRVSAETRKLQLKFFVGSLMQIGIPFVTFAMPLLYGFFSFYTSYYNQVFNNFAVCAISLHGLLGTSCMLLAHKPYRTHLIANTVGKVFKVQTSPVFIRVSKTHV